MCPQHSLLEEDVNSVEVIRDFKVTPKDYKKSLRNIIKHVNIPKKVSGVEAFKLPQTVSYLHPSLGVQSVIILSVWSYSDAMDQVFKTVVAAANNTASATLAAKEYAKGYGYEFKLRSADTSVFYPFREEVKYLKEDPLNRVLFILENIQFYYKLSSGKAAKTST